MLVSGTTSAAATMVVMRSRKVSSVPCPPGGGSERPTVCVPQTSPSLGKGGTLGLYTLVPGVCL